jgi:hypothetical protein
MKTWMWSLLLVQLATTAACTQNTTSGGNTDPERGSVKAVLRGGFLDIEVDAEVTPLSLAATVTVDGAQVTGPAQLGAAATGRDLFKQKATGTNTVRFVVSDTRALRITRTGVVVRVPIAGTPTTAEVKDISAADDQGHNLKLRTFSGAPGNGT